MSSLGDVVVDVEEPATVLAGLDGIVTIVFVDVLGLEVGQ